MLSLAHAARRHVANSSLLASRSLRTSAPLSALGKFKMPAMSPTMTEGGIAAWKKNEGETFAAGDVLLEIETDKATIDVEAQDDGILAKIIKADGTKNIPVGSTIAIIGEEGDDLAGADKLAAEKDDAPEAVPHEDDKPAAKDESKSDSSAAKFDETPKAAPKPEAEAAKVAKKTAEVGGDKPVFFASPIARKIALEKGVPLGQVKGTGPDGRITKSDVENFKGTGAAAAPSAAASA